MINSNLLVTNKTEPLQNVLLILTPNNGNIVKTPILQKVTQNHTPNILTKSKRTSRIISQSPSVLNIQTVAQKNVANSNIPTITLDSGGEDSETYVLNHSEFAALPSQNVVSTQNRKENTEIKEILVTQDQVHYLNQQNEPTEYHSSICRTCLSYMSLESSTKLYPRANKDQNETLRKKITYIAGDIDFSASYDPGVCSKCVVLIDIAYKFKRKVMEVESRINECRYVGGVKTMVSLRHVKKGKYSRRKILIDDIAKVITQNGAQENVKNGNVEKSCTPLKNMDDYLAKKQDFLCRIFSEKVVDKNRPKYRGFQSIDIDPVTGKPDYPVGNKTDENNIPTIGNRLQKQAFYRKKKTFGVGRLSTKISSDNLFSNVNLRVRKEEEGEKWVVLDENYVPKKTVQEDVPKEENPAYEYLFGDKRSYKKPLVPKTYDLFDEDHDKYFEYYQNEPGSMMMRKWRRFRGKALNCGPGPFLCELCGHLALDRKKFLIHTYSHRPRKKMCSHCGKFFTTMLGLREHVSVKHKPPTFQCTSCGKMFHLASMLSNHIQTMHSKTKKRYQCHLCGKFMSYTYYSAHMEGHSGKKFTCDVCHKGFSARHGLYLHRRGHFQGYRCKYCNNFFKSISCLRQHTLKIHKGLRFRCKICGKVLVRKHNMLKHYQKHHGEVPKMKKKEDSGEESNCQEGIDVVYEADVGSARELYENFSEEVNRGSEVGVADSGRNNGIEIEEIMEEIPEEQVGEENQEDHGMEENFEANNEDGEEYYEDNGETQEENYEDETTEGRMVENYEDMEENRQNFEQNHENVEESLQNIKENYEYLEENEDVAKNNEYWEENHQNMEEDLENMEENHENVEENHKDIEENHKDVEENHEDIEENEEHAQKNTFVGEDHENMEENEEDIEENLKNIEDNLQNIEENLEEMDENQDVGEYFNGDLGYIEENVLFDSCIEEVIEYSSQDELANYF